MWQDPVLNKTKQNQYHSSFCKNSFIIITDVELVFGFLGENLLCLNNENQSFLVACFFHLSSN
jgi:hypothetical protein